MTPASEWLALMRVHEGVVTTLDGNYLHQGQPVAAYLEVALDELLRTEYLALSRPDPLGVRQVCVTRAGQARYTALNANGMGEPRHAGR